MAQFANPDGDHDIDSWLDDNGNNNSIMFDDIDEGVASADGNFIRSPANPSDGTAQDCIVTMSNVTDPVSSSGHIIRVRWRKNAAAGRNIDARCRLYVGDPNAGGTLIATLLVTNIGSTFVDSTATLTGTEADNITDYNDLYYRLTGDDTSGSGAGRRLYIDTAEFETPDAPPAVGIPLVMAPYRPA